jgi:hypothetical protein
MHLSKLDSYQYGARAFTISLTITSSLAGFLAT